MLYIENNNKLKEICKEIKTNSNIIGVDTEFIRHRKYFPELCLVQISFIKNKKIKTVLVDTLSEGLNLKPLISIMQSKKIKKIIHSPIQDIEAFYYISKKIPNAIEDTQLMAEFCGFGHYESYGNLVEKICNVKLSKSKSVQRSNWKQRPLKKRQLEYASKDAEFLIQLYKFLKNELENNGNWKFYRNEIKTKINKKFIDSTIKNSWKKLRFKLSGKNLLYVTIVKNLCRWREKEAIERNWIRSNIFPNFAIRLIAKEAPETKSEVKKIFTKDKGKVNLSKPNMRNILKCVQTGKRKYFKDKKKTKKEIIFYFEPKSKNSIKIYNAITKYIKQECKDRNISQELVLNKANIVSVIMNPKKLKDIFYGWKYKIFRKGIKIILKDNKLLYS